MFDCLTVQLLNVPLPSISKIFLSSITELNQAIGFDYQTFHWLRGVNIEKHKIKQPYKPHMEKQQRRQEKKL